MAKNIMINFNEDKWKKLDKKEMEKIFKDTRELYDWLNENELSVHPKWGSKGSKDWAYIPKNVKKIIVGTMPPKRYCHPLYKEYYNKDTFFYESKRNNFWDFFDLKNTTREAKEKWSNKFQVGFLDLIKKCKHCDDKALDNKLDNKTLIDFEEIVSQIKTNKITLICTGYDTKNGAFNCLKELFGNPKELSSKNIKEYDEIINSEKVKIKKSSISKYGKTFEIVMLPSPSNRGTSCTKKAKKEIYNKYICNNN